MVPGKHSPLDRKAIQHLAQPTICRTTRNSNTTQPGPQQPRTSHMKPHTYQTHHSTTFDLQQADTQQPQGNKDKQLPAVGSHQYQPFNHQATTAQTVRCQNSMILVSTHYYGHDPAKHNSLILPHITSDSYQGTPTPNDQHLCQKHFASHPHLPLPHHLANRHPHH